MIKLEEKPNWWIDLKKLFKNAVFSIVYAVNMH